MKRCIICGNMGSDDSTVCEVCGNPYLDLRESSYSDEEPEERKETEDDTDVVYEEDAASVEDTYAETKGKNAVEGDETELQEKREQSEEISKEAPEDPSMWIPEEAPESSFTQAPEEDPLMQMPEEAPEKLEVKLQNDAAVPFSEEDGAFADGLPKEETNDASGEPEKKPAPKRQAPPLRGEPHIYGQSDGDSSGVRRMPSGMIRKEMGNAYEGSRADAPARGAARPAAVRRPEEIQKRTQRAGRPTGRNAAEPIKENGTMESQRRQNRPANGYREPEGMTAGAQRQMPNRNQAAVRPINVQGGPVNMQNRPAGAYVNAARPVNYAAQRIAMSARSVLKSWLMVLIALLQTAYLVGAVMAVFLNQVDFSQIARLLSNVSFPAQMAGYMNGVIGVLSRMGSGAIAANLITHIPDLLLCLGLWMTVFAARTKKEKMSGTGLGLWKAYVVIGMIGACIGMLAGLVVSVALVVSAWLSGTKSVIAISVIILLLLIVVTMLVVMYYFSYLATLKTFRKNANGEMYGTASGYVAVIHIIGGLFGIISLLSGIVNSEIGTTVSAVGQIGWMVLFGLWIFMYRTKMSGEEE